MTRVTTFSLLATAGIAICSANAAQPWLPIVKHECNQACATTKLERTLFDLLPGETRIAIARGMAEKGMTDEAYDRVAGIISRDSFENMRPEWRRALDFYEEHGNPGIAACFSHDTDPAVVMAFSQLLYGEDNRFQINNRWSSTAYSGGGLGQGDPTIISYSFVPDGTTVVDAGFGSGPSQLFTWLNGIYGNPTVWQNHFHSVFDRWAELSGISFVFETNDDGVTQNANNSGVPGVRGDVRIAAKSLDGNGGVLAYNYFPNNGNMVLDAFDSFYNNTGGNSIRLRNIISHEHGHGIGSNHVCPSNGTKLMEPFINTGFDGPQLDDILMVQRLYGDRFEHNDTPATATPLGSSPVISVPQVSIDSNSDVDFYSVNIQEGSEITVTVTPTGTTYIQGPQTQQCNSGSSFDSLRIQDLDVAILDTNGSTVLAFANNNGLGQSETTSAVILETGTYYIRVTGDNTNNIQAYSLTVLVEDLPFFPASISIVGALPDSLDPGVAVPVSVQVTANDEVITPGSEFLRYRGDGGSFQSIPLSNQGGGLYTANLPATTCPDSPEFYFQIEGDLSGAILLPENGPAAPFTAIVGEITVAFEDDFSTDLGWVVGAPDDDATTGIWTRVNPVGTSTGGNQVQPDAPLFGTACYVTGQHPGGGAGANDVDNGKTTLFSPILDLSTYFEPVTISYWRWYSNAAGANPNNDIFVVDISADGGSTWTNVEVVGPAGPQTNGGWFQTVFEPASLIPLTDQVRMRFVASDYDPQALVEAAIDGFKVEGRVCEDPTGGPCNQADLAEPYGVLDLADVNAFISAFIAQDPAADLAPPFGVFDLADLSAFIAAFNAGCP